MSENLRITQLTPEQEALIRVYQEKWLIIALSTQQIDREQAAEAIRVDGFKVYAYHGVRLPEKYGEAPTNEWKAQWLLEERNAELREF